MAESEDSRLQRQKFIAEVRERARAVGLPGEADAITRASLDERDVTGEMRRRVAVLSMGNACEAHGPALAPDIDDRTGAAIAIRVACASGARYLGHVPYATDGVGELAREWSPEFAPFDEFYASSVDFVRLLMAHAYDRAGAARPDLVLFVSGHGGNDVLRGHLERVASDLGARRAMYSLSMRPSAAGIQHADSSEHAVARALGAGCIDPTQIESLASALADDSAGERALLRTMQSSPALAGMAGFYVFGDARFDVIRARYPGVKASVKRFVEERAIGADVARGQAIVDETVATIRDELLQAARELSIRLPWFAV